MNARSGVSRPHALGTVGCHCWHRLHDCRVDRSSFGLAAQMHDVVVQRCVAACAEYHEHKEYTAQPLRLSAMARNVPWMRPRIGQGWRESDHGYSHN
eukprot:1215068-Pleurochrysis_carterae.AAC.3